MKLHVAIIQEEAISIKLASDIWTENKDGAKTYISNTIYYVRKVEGKDEFEVNVEDSANKRSTYAKLSKRNLDAAFVPLRPKDPPDAEGYIQYRDVNEVQAIQYDADTVKVDLDGGGIVFAKLLAGDYLIQQSDATDFSYSVQKAKNFENLYSKK